MHGWTEQPILLGRNTPHAPPPQRPRWRSALTLYLRGTAAPVFAGNLAFLFRLAAHQRVRLSQIYGQGSIGPTRPRLDRSALVPFLFNRALDPGACWIRHRRIR